MADDRHGPAAGRGRFATTRWSLVLAAGGPAAPGSEEALATLCRQYWYPLYAYSRRDGYPHERAEDLVQAFFVKLFEKQSLQFARAERGRFRSFLLVSFKHFVANEYERERAAKRGAGDPVISLDVSSAESRYALEPRDGLTPEVLFERQWAHALVDRVQVRLRTFFVRAGKGAVFEQLKACVTPDASELDYREIAASLGMTEGAVRVAGHRLRRRFRELLRDEIRQTVDGEQGIDEEITFLMATLAATGAAGP